MMTRKEKLEKVLEEKKWQLQAMSEPLDKESCLEIQKDIEKLNRVLKTL